MLIILTGAKKSLTGGDSAPMGYLTMSIVKTGGEGLLALYG